MQRLLLLLTLVSVSGCSLISDFGSIDFTYGKDGGTDNPFGGDGDGDGDGDSGINTQDMDAGEDSGSPKDAGKDAARDTGTPPYCTGDDDAGCQACEEDHECEGDLVCEDGLCIEFVPDPEYLVAVAVVGNGSGTVASDLDGIDCPGDCNDDFVFDTEVTLTATPDPGSTFLGWTGGGCSGTSSCVITGNDDVVVQASFALDNSLVVTKDGNGMGLVTSSPLGIDCGADCDETVSPGTTLTLSASPVGDADFSGWTGGGCSGTGDCVVTVNASVLVSATFTLRKHGLTTTRAGNGMGAVASNPVGILCGSDCAEDYDSGTLVAITALPATGSDFGGWSGDCTGTGACMVSMTADRSVTANFVLERHDLQVKKLGNGAGTVSSVSAGISCGPDCEQTYDYGSMTTLNASAAYGSVFAGWSGGGCSGTGACMVRVTAATSVSATFTLRNWDVDVDKAGDGHGTVTSTPTGVSCGADCSGSYLHGTQVTLNASPSTGSSFDGWSGDCSGNSCVLDVTSNRQVDANFSLRSYPLTVAKAGSGGGIVTADLGNIYCGSNCSDDYLYGSTVVLQARPGTFSTFTGWSGGGCSGTGNCKLDIGDVTAVTATFATTCETVEYKGNTHVTANYSTGTTTFNENFTASNSSMAPVDTTGWVGFDVSPIPDGAIVTASSLVAYNSLNQGTPVIRVQYSSADDWDGDKVLVSQLPRTTLSLGGTSQPRQGEFNEYDLDVGGMDWPGDLTDDWVTVGLDNLTTATSSAQFDGYKTSAPPILRVTYCPCVRDAIRVDADRNVSFDYGPAATAYRDDVVRASNTPDENADVTGWMGFDLSGMPDQMQIFDVVLNVYASSVAANPLVRAQLSNVGPWEPGGVARGELPRTVEQLSDSTTVSLNTNNSLPLYSNLISWPDMLEQNFVTIGVDNPNSAKSYGFFEGAKLDNPPSLEIHYCR